MSEDNELREASEQLHAAINKVLELEKALTIAREEMRAANNELAHVAAKSGIEIKVL